MQNIVAIALTKEKVQKKKERKSTVTTQRFNSLSMKCN